MSRLADVMMGGSVPESPAEPFRLCPGQRAVRNSSLEPGDEIRSSQDGLEPLLVRCEIGAWEPFQPRSPSTTQCGLRHGRGQRHAVQLAGWPS